jgi:hypothetical protein
LQDFQAVKYLRDDNTETYARYLRDTAENAVVLLQDTDFNRRKLEEMVDTLEMAKRVVEDLSGKVRKFDVGYRRPRPRHKEGHGDHRTHGYRQGRREAYSASKEGETYIKTEHELTKTRISVDTDARQQDMYDVRRAQDVNSRAYRANCTAQPSREAHTSDRRRITDERGYGATDTYSRRRSRSPVRRPDKRRRERASTGNNSGIRFKGNAKTDDLKQEKGRGHSGIPYGYREGRMVDSYRPGA